MKRSPFAPLAWRPRAVNLQTQRMQAWARIGFALAGLAYLGWHAPYLATPFGRAFFAVAAGYFLLQALSLVWIQRKRHSLARILLLPIGDVFVIGYGSLLDGGVHSGIYLVLFVVVFGNALRYGKGMLAYTQALALLTPGIVAIVHHRLGWPIDGVLLAWQFGALWVLPFYVQRILDRAEKARFAQHRAEDALARMLRHGPLPTFTFALDGENTPRVRFANASALVLCGRTLEEVEFSQPDLFVAPEDGAQFNDFCRRVLLDAERVTTIGVRGRQRKHNHPQQLLCVAMALPSANGAIGVCHLLDVTERELVREAIARAEHDAQLLIALGGIVHDFRNMLTGILGHTEILRFEHDPEERARSIEEIALAAERGSELLNEVMRRIRHKHRHPSERPLKREDIEHALSLARVQLPPRAELIAEVDDSLPETRISAIEVEQILLNLISNAAAAIEDEGRIEVRIGKAVQEGSSMLEIVVRDDGIGIPESEQKLIFEPFWTTHAREGGSGLGLATVRAIVHRYRGRIELESALGKGSTFRILIPARERIEPGTSARQAPAKARSAAMPRPACALIADDRDDARTAIQRMLHSLGIPVVHTAADGEEAFAQLAKAPGSIELLITDYQMPKRDGLSLIEAVRKLRPELPIVLLTAYAEMEHVPPMARRLRVALLAKPVGRHALQHAIAEAYRIVSSSSNERAEKSA